MRVFCLKLFGDDKCNDVTLDSSNTQTIWAMKYKNTGDCIQLHETRERKCISFV